MVDGAIVLVDAAEGPMPQTKFVLSKALARGLRPIVAINKIDRPDERHQEVLNEVFDLFAALDATDEQLDFPVLYGSAKQGWMAAHAGRRRKVSTAPLFDLVLSHVPPPMVEEGPFRMLATTLEANPYLGRILTGRITSGTVRPNMPVKVAVARRQARRGRAASPRCSASAVSSASPIDEAEAGDIVAIAGLTTATVADTIAAPEVTEPLAAQPIDPPTLSMTFRINDGPLAGQEGDKVQSRVIRERLLREAEGNVALKITENADHDSFEVAGRGELQLGILIETMRREGFELTIGKPRVVFRTAPDGTLLEPIEEVIIDVDRRAFRHRRPEALRAPRRAPRNAPLGRRPHAPRLPRADPRPDRLPVGAPVRHARHRGLQPPVPRIRALQGRHRRAGGTASSSPTARAKSTDYALWYLEDRGALLIDPGIRVYEGMIVGEHSRGNDLEVNVAQGQAALQRPRRRQGGGRACSPRRAACRSRRRSPTSRRTSWSR